jgi:hypothetical protein
MSRATHRRIYSFFTALRARSFIHIFTQTHHIPLPQLVQAVTFKNKGQKVTYRQIYYACTTQATPRKRSGRAPVITAAQIDQLVEYISQSRTTRRLPLWRLAIDLSFEGIGVTVARSALRRVGYKR